MYVPFTPAADVRTRARRAAWLGPLLGPLPGLLGLIALGTACEHDPLPTAGNGGGGGSFVATPFLGTWVGTWTNLALNTSGPATLVVDLVGNTLVARIDLDGDVFGAGDPPEQTFVAQIGASAAVLSPQNSTFFGQVAGRLEADGSVIAVVDDVPPGLVRQIDIIGTWLANSLDLDATLTYPAGSSPETARAAVRFAKQ
ncbi:MAG: hypothetical protein R3F56_02450 [Planctomycetota bacterium]